MEELKMKLRKQILQLAGGVAAAAMLASGAAQAADLPKTMIWTSYDFGSAGFAQASAVANAFQKKFGTRIRIVPSGTGIGRLLPVTQRKAHYGFLATETYFAAEGTYDFAVTSWGPQDLRIILAPPVATGLTVPKGSKFADGANLKGVKLGYVKGNPSVNVKTDALLAYAGLTRADITPVWFGGYGVMKGARLTGKIDGFLMSPYSGITRELEASPAGIEWVQFDPANKDGWKRIQSIAPMYSPVKSDDGAGMVKGKPVNIIEFRYPMMVTYADRSEAEVYQVTKAMHEAFALYKDVNATTKNWILSTAGHPPADVAWHPGSIKFLKEQGVWSAADEAWNQARLARHAKVIEEWDNATDAFNTWRAEEKKKKNKIKVSEAWPKYWADHRKKVGLD
ncbi:MAG: TAXI family TRAP transporter solute-binding subunit [Alphaproteobacteria bacterium]|nr:TAXI family TRAP transporter solute-binding subunit [Alphaproteobacteria bacterium]